jgi:hypothetical protein
MAARPLPGKPSASLTPKERILRVYGDAAHTALPRRSCRPSFRNRCMTPIYAAVEPLRSRFTPRES